MYKYEIEGKTFVQKKLVWGQVRQLMEVLKGVQRIPMGGAPMALFDALGDKLPHILAIILTEEGQSVKDKDLPALASLFEFDFPLDILIKVAEDFFACNPTASYLETLVKLIGALSLAIEENLENTLKGSESSSVEETLQKET